MKTSEIRNILKDEKARSAWGNGVKIHALELLETLAEIHGEGYDVIGSSADAKTLLNGADNWEQYSWGGCALIYDCDIARRLCTPSELKKTRNGDLRPNGREEWLDTQSRALHQAAHLIMAVAGNGTC